MLRAALASADAILAAAARAGVRLCYAENFVYAPPIRRAAELVRESGGAILEVRAAECHSGSHAAYARRWATAGGGSLLRLGAHPIGAALYLKRMEGLHRGGAPITLAAVTAEVGDPTRHPAVQGAPDAYLVREWEDVESWAAAILTFTDGTRAVCLASDIALGGIEDWVELLLSNARIRANFGHSDLLTVYTPDDSVLPGEPLQEKLHGNHGWSFPHVDQEFLFGYRSELQDFVRAIATDRPPESDGALGRAVVEAIYAAYLAAERRQTVEIAALQPAGRAGD